MVVARPKRSCCGPELSLKLENLSVTSFIRFTISFDFIINDNPTSLFIREKETKYELKSGEKIIKS